MGTRKFYAGLDMGTSVCELVMVREKGVPVAQRTFVPSEKNLIRAVEEVARECGGKIHLALEEGELADWTARVLRPHVERVYICDPRRNSLIAKDPQKSDKVDAKNLAILLMMNQIREVYHPEQDDRMVFKRVVQHYEEQVQQARRLMMQIKARFRGLGIIARGNDVYMPAGRGSWLAQVKIPEMQKILQDHYEVLDDVKKRAKEARRTMVQYGQRYPEVQNAQEVPGIGPVLACRFSAYVQTPHRFKNKRKLWRYSRMSVTDRSSNGKPLGRRCLEQMGNGTLKDLSRLAFQGAVKTSKKDNLFKRFYQESLKRGVKEIPARLNTQRKILAVLYGMWKGGTKFRDAG